MSSYKDLVVWKKSIDLATLTYKLTDKFPREEIYGISSQLKRAAVSVASNIAEGSIRGSKKDFCHFLRIASGSIAELQTQIEICKHLPFGEKLDYNEIDGLSVEINKMIHGLINKLKS
ncbi:MAG: four helix bundle protein [Candidatus Zambryskibacteria bacterium RIFCSPHIGHO2_02_FULL_39_16]|uniref:Four helix bundle protein n=1 Tax=Candidatus Zambryskibacteria bacterium RIFCSPLOWO2_02_FULL_39_14 TaxID=1802769 RepID=A0A1G2UHC0_9BACT|nr:MAG: four helix bundle protein [Candidatus Zambryskibacteria bacterium RIFCSPHIGHO2_02_FULL_39_16]OHB08795.1 MAG: four helix bundle protein [Candidatus Zambryskibacteria bacterium RIFCSPLOWO2_02_FULL_39_14]